MADKPKRWISAMHLKKGAFTAQAKHAGMSVQQYASKVLKPDSHASATTKRRARLAQTFARMHH